MRAKYFFGTLLMITTACWGETESLTVQLRVYALTGVRRAEVVGALDECAHIFRTARIGLTWTEGDPADPDAHLLDESVPSVPAAIQGVVVTRIVSAAGPGFPAEALGRTLPFGVSAAQITIFLDNIRSQAQRAEIPVPTLLGYVLAHELGHVLLRFGDDPHRSAGLMRPQWGAREFDRIHHGALKFTHAQEIALRRRLTEYVGRSLSRTGPSAATNTRTSMPLEEIRQRHMEYFR